jgi:putative salt-induced outer membrane protein YdiY
MHAAITASLLCLIGSLTAAPAAAQVVPPPSAPAKTAAGTEPGFEGTGEFSFVGTSGNSNTSTTGIGGGTAWHREAWSLEQRGRFVRERASGVISAQSFTYRGAAVRAVTPRFSAYGEYRYLRDLFAGLRQQHLAYFGLATSVLKNDRADLAVRTAVGGMIEHRTTTSALRAPAYGVGVIYKFRISSAAEVHGDLLGIGRFDARNDWRLAHTVELTATLTRLFALRVGHAVRYVNLPVPSGGATMRPTTDTTSTVSLVLRITR